MSKQPGRLARRAWPGLLLLCALAARTQPIGAAAGMDFESARQRLQAVSDRLGAAADNLRGKRSDAEALEGLHGPQVDLDVKEIRSQKTVDVPLGGLRTFLDGLPSPPPVQLPGELQVRDRGSRFRPVVSASVPLYTGGRIEAVQHGAQAAVAQASAESASEGEALTLQLAQSYFGQALAERAARIQHQVLDGMATHLRHAAELERQGMASRSQRLQAQVAHDEAARNAAKADDDLEQARVVLASLLHEAAPVRLRTPLFVVSERIDALQRAAEEGIRQHPQIDRLEALRAQRTAALKIEQSKFAPQVVLFGQYDLHRRSALLTEPDWVVGIGLRYPLYASTDRAASISAARAREAQAERGIRQARIDLTTQARVAFSRLETARRQFLLLDSSTELAAENLRLQDLSFQEGQATSLDVIDARLSLGRAQVQRAAAACQFDVALAQVLHALGRAASFGDYLRLADKVIADE